MNLSLKIYWAFLKITLIAFGGVLAVLPELEKVIVNQLGWITQEQFMQAYAIAQFVPGPNVAMLPLLGYMVNGWTGFGAGFLAAYTGPILIMSTAVALYQRYRSLDWVRRCEIALRPMVLGLMCAAVTRFWWAQTTSASHAVELRLVAIAMSLLAYWLYQRKVFTSALQLIFSVGGVWWLAKWSFGA